MDKSLSDTQGNYIDKLVHYPTPEAIKSLVLTAAADNDQAGYRLVHANTSLKRLAQRADWPKLLEQAIQTYPELSQAQELLLNWDFTEYERHPDIKEASSQLAKRIYNDKAEDDRLRTMARNTLSNNALIAEMATNGILSQEDLLAYQRASDLVVKLSQLKDNNLESAKAKEAEEIRVNLLIWEEKLRSILKSLNNAEPESKKYSQLLANLKASLYLTELWEKNQDDLKKLSFLTSYNLIDIVGDYVGKFSVSIEDLNFFDEAYDTYPCLQDNRNEWSFQVFKQKPSYFFNKSGMDFFQEFNDKYSDKPRTSESNSLIKILSQVADGQLSRENALSFYERVPELFDDKLILLDNVKFELVSDEGLQFLTEFYQTHLENNFNREISIGVLEAVGQGHIQPEMSYDYIKILPDLFKKDRAILRLFIFNNSKYIANNVEDLQFLNKFMGVHGKETLSDNDSNVLIKILSKVAYGQLSRENALSFYEHAPELLNDKLILLNNVKFELVSDEGLAFLTEFYQTYLENKFDREVSIGALQAVGQGHIQPEMSYDYIKILPHLFNKDQESLKLFVFNNSKDITNNVEDLKFLSRFIGTHGKKSLTILQEYVACIKEGVVTSENRNKILNFTQKFRALSPMIAEGYLKAEARNLEEAYIAELQQLSSQMISSEPLPEEDRQNPFYKDLLKAVYANNAGTYGGLEQTKACTDRTADLAQFTYDSKYEIDLLESANIKVKEGEVINESAIESLKQPISTLEEEMKSKNFDLEKVQAELEEKVDALLENKLAGGGLENLDLKQLKTLDEKMFILLADSVYTDKTVPNQELKDLILRYEFAFFEDVRDYIQGITDRVSQASNQEYALMCELHSFFADRIKEVNRRLVKAGWENQALKDKMQEYFAKIVQEKAQAQLNDQSNRFRLDRLGMSDSFIAQISRTIEKRMGKQYPPETIKKLILYYENLTQGLSVDSTSEKNTTRAFYGQLQAQRNKTMEAIETLTGESLNLQDFRLADTNLEDLAISLANIDTGEYDEEQFQALTALRFINLFADEQNLLESELAKFESESGKQRQVINGFFSKTKESANARMVGGVCVSRDNPLADRSPEEQNLNMWDTENYFQLVLQDPETNRCLGLVLLHHFEEKGEKVLSASLNPSSTFLYSTDEESLFNGLMKVLETFAKNNNFDKVLLSKNRAIRTNRTGGKFEKAMNEKVHQTNKKFSFEEEKIFSYSPGYKLKDMDVVWEKQ